MLVLKISVAKMRIEYLRADIINKLSFAQNHRFAQEGGEGGIKQKPSKKELVDKHAIKLI